MALTIEVGQMGTLSFQPAMVGIDPATVTGVAWSQQGSPAAVKFTHPDQVEGIAPGTGSFTVTVNCGPSDKMPYQFEIACIANAPPAIPKVVPVMILFAIPP
jgi:hypothetical protein